MTNLKKLRELYQGKDAFDIWRLEYRAIAQTVFPNKHAQATWAFDNSPTFLDLPLATQEEWQQLDVGIVGIPIDIGVTHRAGARFGPRALRNTERIGPYEHVLAQAPIMKLNAADLGDVPFDNRFNIEQSHQSIENYFRALHHANVTPLAVGGDHSITLPILRALGRDKPVGLIHLDAHCDTAGLFYGNQHHGSPFRQAVLDGVLDPKRTIQIGIRGPDEYFWEFSHESGMTVIHAEEVFQQGVNAILQQINHVIAQGPVYVSVDIDCLDPSYAPGTGTPEVNGLTPREVFAILRGIAGKNIIGGDIVEVAPVYDPTTNTATLAGQILFTLYTLLACNQQIVAKNKQ